MAHTLNLPAEIFWRS